jgi:hypothetical protein
MGITIRIKITRRAERAAILGREVPVEGMGDGRSEMGANGTS